MPLVDYDSSPSESDGEGDVDRGAEALADPAAETPSKSFGRKWPAVAPHSQEDSGDGKDAPNTELPPLPPSFHNLYAFATRSTTQDDPALHGGRKRAVPHVEGNWPSHVYLESPVDSLRSWLRLTAPRGQPSPTETKLLNQLINAVASHLPRDSQAGLQPLFESDLAAPRPLHISLSHSLNLRVDQRNDFAEALASSIQSPGSRQLRKKRHYERDVVHKRPRIPPFTTRLAALDWAPNDAKTRWFLVLRVAKPDGDALNHLLLACNSVAQDFKQPELYTGRQDAGNAAKRTKRQDGQMQQSTRAYETTQEDVTDRFHFSIAWTLQEPKADVTTEQLSALERSNASMAESLMELRGIELRFDTVKLKIGNEVVPIVLSDTVEHATKGILGK